MVIILTTFVVKGTTFRRARGSRAEAHEAREFEMQSTMPPVIACEIPGEGPVASAPPAPVTV